MRPPIRSPTPATDAADPRSTSCRSPVANRRHLRQLVGPQVPERIELQQPPIRPSTPASSRRMRRTYREHRHHAHADDIALGAARPRELGVLLEPHHRQVRADQCEKDRRQHQNMQRVQPRYQRGAGKVSAEEGPVQPGPITGNPNMIDESAQRRPIPDSRSSGSEYRNNLRTSRRSAGASR